MLILSYLLALVCPPCPAWCALPAGHAPDHADPVDGSVSAEHRAPLLADLPNGRRLDLVQTTTSFPDGQVDPGEPLVVIDGRVDDALTLDQARRFAEAIGLAADLAELGRSTAAGGVR